MKIKSMPFDKETANKLSQNDIARNWPVVYILNNRKEAYIGETTSASNRLKQHLDNDDKKRLTDVSIIIDDRFNKSAVLDIESKLIEYMSADQLFELQNSNSGMRNHNYYDKVFYEALFRDIWNNLKKKKIVKHDIDLLMNSDLFKYTPYKQLTTEQFDVVFEIVLDLLISIQIGTDLTVVVNGESGTGKTVLAMYIMKMVADNSMLELLGSIDDQYIERFIEMQEKLKNFSVALVVPQSSLRASLKRVAKEIKGLKANMIIGPTEAARGNYDLLIVDEAHRLKQRKNLVNMGSYDQLNRDKGYAIDTTQLKWIMDASPYQILFYDAEQSVMPSDVSDEEFLKASTGKNSKQYVIKSQLRVKGGNDYLNYIKSILSDTPPLHPVTFGEYDFVLFENITSMKNEILDKENMFGLSRLVAGYAWKWNTKGLNYEDALRNNVYDIEIENERFIWNQANIGWVNSKNAINEVGSIHTIQGYDLNYVGVIIGPELSYDFSRNEFVVYPEKYFDKNGKRTVKDMNELKNYILNIYKVLLTRAIEGTYLYVCDDNLRKYLKRFIKINGI